MVINEYKLTANPSTEELNRSYQSRSLNGRNQSIFIRYKWFILSLISFLIITALTLCIVFLVIIPKQQNQSNNFMPTLVEINSNGLVEKPDLTIIPKDLGEFNDNISPNKNTPALNQVFEYGKMKIRGVNLGGWLVPEPFIVPSIYEDKIDEGVLDEWTLCETIGKKECTKRLIKHYETFLTEEDIKIIRDAGLNHVRIPIGYWMIDNQDNENFIYGSWKYLLRGLQWCRKYGIRVMIDFHAAPGSQNGWNHSGRFGDIRFLNKNFTESEGNVKRFSNILLQVVDYFSTPEWNNLVTQIGVLNEPAVYKTHDQIGILNFYKQIYESVRKNRNNDNNLPLLVYHEGFLGLDKWHNKMPKENFKNIVLDSHNYIIFAKELISKSLNDINDFPCTAWAKDFTTSSEKFGWTMCGEFSVASNDCGKWLNGIKLGSRYDGTYDGDSAICEQCSCEGKDDVSKFTNEYKQFLKQFAEKQMDAFENGIGWYFWNFKTENHINPHWDYFLGLKEGWMPKDASKRTYSCKQTLEKS
ncbi:glycoside hydrolase [Neoconidiobolus thromboides FSU 785]|nr:glycoside hydrolase [Neoconidiobolus thromboides FSU 785]